MSTVDDNLNYRSTLRSFYAQTSHSSPLHPAGPAYSTFGSPLCTLCTSLPPLLPSTALRPPRQVRPGAGGVIVARRRRSLSSKSSTDAPQQVGKRAPSIAWPSCFLQAVPSREMLSKSVGSRGKATVGIRSLRGCSMDGGTVGSAGGAACGRMRRKSSIMCGTSTATPHTRIDGEPLSALVVPQTNIHTHVNE